MKLRALSVALIAAAILAAGCGGSKSTGAAATSSITTGTTPPAGASAAVSSTQASSSTALASTGDCRQLAGLAHTFEHAIAAARNGPSDFAPAVAAFHALANAGPAQIRPDLQVVANAFGTYAASLARLGLKQNTAPTSSQMSGIYMALQTFGAPPVRAASRRIKAWVHQNCAPAS